METRELEIKLAASAPTLARLAADPVLGAPAGRARKLVAIYFDTPRFALWRRGLTLRLRREGGRWIQAVKGRGGVEAGLHRRIEIERRAAAPVPDLALVRDEPLGREIARAARTAALVPAFRTEFVRATRVLRPEPGVRIELSLDRGAIFAGSAHAPICEVELELVSGPEWRLYEIARMLAARRALRLERRSKAERGYALVGAVRAAPVRARMGVIREEMTASDAFRAVCLMCLDHLQANFEGAVRGDDPEYLHQARVALRRLRSGIAAFEPLFPEGMLEPQLAALRGLARALGPARDWDVFAEHVLAPVMQQFPGHRGLAALERACVRMRADANRAARGALLGRRYPAFVLGFGEWVARAPWRHEAPRKARRAWRAPVRDYADTVLERCQRRVLKRGRGIATLDTPRLHRLRIAVKKLRYAAGFFAPLYPRRRAKPVLDALNGLQDVLGAINDCSTAPALIDSAYAAARGPLRREARAIASRWNAAMLEDRRQALKGAWKAFHGCRRFWR